MSEGGGVDPAVPMDDAGILYENVEHLEDPSFSTENNISVDEAGPSGAHTFTQKDLSKSPTETTPPRIKVYSANSTLAGPWVVFFRPKPNGKPLNVIQITKTLAKWSSVTSVTKVRPNKLRVVVASLKAANEIVASNHFNLEYRVFVPSREVEIEGVISEMSLTAEYVKAHGVGRFRSLDSTEVKILDCRQLVTASVVAGVKKYSPSASFRVTFEGTALPHYVLIDDMLRLPVRLFVPRPMNCDKCVKIGHTASHCCSKPRCSRCGDNHGDGSCSATVHKCVYCGGSPHDLSSCDAFKNSWVKQRRSLMERSKRSYAAVLKSISPPVESLSNNVFSVLPVDDGATDTTDEEQPSFLLGSSRKRSKVTSPKIPKKVPLISSSISSGKKSSVDKENQIPPGFRGKTTSSNDPAVAGTSKHPTPNTSSSAVTVQMGLFKLSDIVNGLLSFFDASDSIRSIISAMLPIVKTFFEQLMQTWPLLSVFISLDG